MCGEPCAESAARQRLRGGSDQRSIRCKHFKRCNSLGYMIGPVAPPWASVLSRLGVQHVLGPPDKIVRAS